MRIYEKLSEVINSSPALVAAVVVLLLITGLYGMTLTEMETGFETYMDPDTPRYILLDKYMSTFSTDSIMLLVETEDVLNPVILEYTGRLQDDIAEERYVTGVIGITDQFRAANGGELPESIAEVEAAKEHIPADLLERLVPTTSMTIIQVNLEPGVSLDTQFSVVDAIESRISVSDPPPGVSVVQTGNPAFAKQMMDEMGVSMSSLILIAMLLMVAAIGILFSAVRYRLLSVGIVATGSS